MSGLEAEIAELTRDLNDTYIEAVHKRESLKGKMDELERKLSAAHGAQALCLGEELELASNRLNELCDSLCLASKGCKERVLALEDRATAAGFDVQLDKAKATAKRIEEVASDLLCYSLGR